MSDEATELRRADALKQVIRRTKKRIDTLRARLPDLVVERGERMTERDRAFHKRDQALAEKAHFTALVDDLQCGRTPFDYERYEVCKACAQNSAANATAFAGKGEGYHQEAVRIGAVIDEMLAEIAANTARVDLCTERRDTILTQVAVAREEAADDEVSETAALSHGRATATGSRGSLPRRRGVRRDLRHA